MYLEEKENDLTTYASMIKLHEVNNHRGEHQLINAYSKTGQMSPKVSENIKMVVQNCKICQKFVMSVSRPKVTLPKLSTFNEVVTLDLKLFGSKYVLWIIESFSRFVQSKVFQNERAETIVKAVCEYKDGRTDCKIGGYY